MNINDLKEHHIYIVETSPTQLPQKIKVLEITETSIFLEFMDVKSKCRYLKKNLSWNIHEDRGATLPDFNIIEKLRQIK